MKANTLFRHHRVLAAASLLALIAHEGKASDFRSAQQPSAAAEESLFAVPEGAPVNWSENFDAYTTGSEVIGQGAWEGWGGSSTVGALTSSAQARSAPNSVDVVGDTDLVHGYPGTTSGQWTYTAWQFLPTALTGRTYLILLNTHPADPMVFGHWSVQLCFDGTANVVMDDTSGSCNTGATAPLVKNQWVEIRVEIDLDADTQTVFYNGTQLYTAAWSTHLGATGGAVAVGAVDLFANAATSAFYDDLSLVRTPLFNDGFESEDTTEWDVTVP